MGAWRRGGGGRGRAGGEAGGGGEGDGDAGGRANGAAGEDEGVAGVARGRREEVEEAREDAAIAVREGCPVSPLSQLCPHSSAPFFIVKGLYLGQVFSQVSAVVCLWLKLVGQKEAITRARAPTAFV